MKKQTIALTGRLRIGKDYVATHCQGTILGFADPLYVLGEYLTGLGPAHKDTVPFLRELYQKLGQWGRGDVNEQYPLSIERCLMGIWAKTVAVQQLVPYVDFSKWGVGGDIWLDALLRRAAEMPNTRLFVTNCRFQNEYKALVGSGWDHWHVMCSRHTYEERLREVNMSINDKRISDVSEQLAAQLDNAVVNIIKTEPVGPKLKVIWNDNRPSPCERLQTLEQFQAYITNNEVEPEYTTYGNETSNPTPAIADPASESENRAGDAPQHSEDARAERQQDRDPAARRRARKSGASA